MKILGLETSCDETAAAVADGRTVLSSVVFSQTTLHAPYGGVVPEIASRNHLEALPAIVRQALQDAKAAWSGLDAVAVTYGPGLASSLLVGVAYARGIAMRLGIPFIAVNHLEAHLYSPFLTAGRPDFNAACPLLALIVSGGHTCLVRAERIGSYRLLGTTLDDAAGEAFDKGAKLLGLGYPGGPAINKLSAGGRPGTIEFPRGSIAPANLPHALESDLCFSFSGLKTSLYYYLRRQQSAISPQTKADIAASYQEAIVDALCGRLLLAAQRENIGRVAVVGGVSLNSRLREKAVALGRKYSLEIFFAEPQYCMDNAAMVAGLAGAGRGAAGSEDWQLDVRPDLKIGI